MKLKMSLLCIALIATPAASIYAKKAPKRAKAKAVVTMSAEEREAEALLAEADAVDLTTPNAEAITTFEPAPAKTVEAVATPVVEAPAKVVEAVAAPVAEAVAPVAEAVAAAPAKVVEAATGAVKIAPLPAGHVGIHYYRPDGNYEGWGIHHWGDAYDGDASWFKAFPVTGTDGFGAYYHIKHNTDPELFESAQANYIIHKGDTKDQCSKDMSWEIKDAKEIFVVSNDCKVYLTLDDALKAKAGAK